MDMHRLTLVHTYLHTLHTYIVYPYTPTYLHATYLHTHIPILTYIHIYIPTYFLEWSTVFLVIYIWTPVFHWLMDGDTKCLGCYDCHCHCLTNCCNGIIKEYLRRNSLSSFYVQYHQVISKCTWRTYNLWRDHWLYSNFITKYHLLQSPMDKGQFYNFWGCVESHWGNQKEPLGSGLPYR